MHGLGLKFIHVDSGFHNYCIICSVVYILLEVEFMDKKRANFLFCNEVRIYHRLALYICAHHNSPYNIFFIVEVGFFLFLVVGGRYRYRVVKYRCVGHFFPLSAACISLGILRPIFPNIYTVGKKIIRRLLILPL